MEKRVRKDVRTLAFVEHEIALMEPKNKDVVQSF